MPEFIQRTISVTLNIAPDGTVSLHQATPFDPITLAGANKPAERPPKYDAPFDNDYARRPGYRPAFLGEAHPAVLLPRMAPELAERAARLREPAEGADPYELRYHNFSVAMHAARRLAIYSAANVSAGQRFQMGRPSDQWRLDPRIDDEVQLGNFYYASNRFDRGHLTRREDLEFGATPTAALQSAADTCHWTNCAPQQERFNQGKELWQGLERYVLEEGVRRHQLNIQVFTGPIFEDDDPVYERFPEIQYPLRFWKVIAAPMPDGALSVTGYILDQSGMITQHGIEGVRPFGDFNSFQVPVKEIEVLTGLRFEAEGSDGQPVALHSFDPLEASAPRRTLRAAPPAGPLPRHWSERFVPLAQFEDIVL